MTLNKLEIRRQLFHLILGVKLVILLKYSLMNSFWMFLLILAGFGLSHLSLKMKIPVISWFLEKFERFEDMKTFPGRGAIYYLIGSFIAVFLFPKDIAMASIMILAFGDSVAHLFGTHIGKIRNPLSSGKFLEGTLLGFLAAFAASIPFVMPFEAFFASLFAMIIEGFEVRFGVNKVDDNLIIPFASGLVILGVRVLF